MIPVNAPVVPLEAKQYVNDANGVLTVTVDNQPLTSWTTTSANKDYTVDIPAKTASSTISFSTASGSGNRVYVDYAKLATQGAVPTAVSVSGYPKQVGVVLTEVVEGLALNTTYYYTVTPQGNSGLVSAQVAVTTLLDDAVKPVVKFALKWLHQADGLLLSNLPPNCNVSVLNTMGVKIETQKVLNTEAKIKLGQHGIYLIQVQQNQNTSHFKVLY